MNGVRGKRAPDIREMLEREYEGKEIRMNEAVHTVRHMDKIAFVILHKSRGPVQCVYGVGGTDFDVKDLKEKSAMEMVDAVRAERRAPQGFETKLKEIRVLLQPTEPLPLTVSKQKLNTSLETKLSLRPISPRNVREWARFKIQEGIVRGFWDYLLSQDSAEIHTPKIMARGAEGGSNVFKLEYFNKKAELGQSPQFYRQIIVGVYGKVFEATPASRAEEHNITHHLNRYISLDFGIGYIDSFRDVMDTETGVLQYVMRLLKQEYKKELDMLGVTLPEVGQIPAVRFDRAEKLVSRRYGRKIHSPYDLGPEEELFIGRYFKEEYRGDFVFVTHCPSEKRPFYTMDDPEDPKFTLSFDLMLRGLEVTTGGQRTYDYKEIVGKMEKRNMDPEDIVSYLMIFKYGTLPHGGLGIGLEHLTMRLPNEQNIREASMFSRDVARLKP